MEKMNTKEIERKFLIERFPDTIQHLLSEFEIEQAYLSIDPEVRIRRKHKVGEYSLYFLTIKSNGDLIRDEVEIQINSVHYHTLMNMIQKPVITKLNRNYQLMDGLILECFLVDQGTENEFMYAEIEFPSEEEAEHFVMPSWFIKDITYDKSFKMKNYWKRTRGV